MKPQAELMRFVVTFQDGEVVEGAPLGSLDTGWNNLPDKPIERLAYTNPYGDQIVLQDYQEYNHMIECVQHMGGRPYVTDIYLMGSRRNIEDDKVVVYKLTAFQKSDDGFPLVGDVNVRVHPRGKEYLGSETWGWRRGISPD
ncbi:MAG: hypothetical protein ACE5IC_09010 [Candidatus Brocadiales bacterium]